MATTPGSTPVPPVPTTWTAALRAVVLSSAGCPLMFSPQASTLPAAFSARLGSLAATVDAAARDLGALAREAVEAVVAVGGARRVLSAAELGQGLAHLEPVAGRVQAVGVAAQCGPALLVPEVGQPAGVVVGETRGGRV